MSNYLLLDGTGRASTPNVAGLVINGDIDMRVLARFATLEPSAVNSMLSRGNTYRFDLNTTDALRTFWHDGTSLISPQSTVDPFTILDDGVDYWFRTTLDVNNGAGGYDLNFYYSLRDPISWVQIGATVVGGTTTVIRNGTEALDVGQSFGANGFIGRLYEVIILNGINGAESSHFNADDFAAGDDAGDTAVDSTGKTWTIVGATSLIVAEPEVGSGRAIRSPRYGVTRVARR